MKSYQRYESRQNFKKKILSCVKIWKIVLKQEINIRYNETKRIVTNYKETRDP